MSTVSEQLKEKESHVVNFVKSFIALEEAMEPYKEQKRDLRDSYHQNNWLSKEEMRMAIRAYRLMKSETDIEELVDMFSSLKKKVGTNV
jgi:hypothetical protein|tara:strand:- start:148 stop:414 length:267 start_codon:yes stop_codon:yes gene_type:complete